MKPAKAFYPFAAWLIRLTMLLFTYVFFFETIRAFDYNSVEFYIASAFAIFSVLVLVGGFLSKPAMTVVSAFFLFGLSVYQLIIHFSEKPDTITVAYMLSISAMLVLFSVGNKK
ncbi:MAG: hypothetical protein A2W93_01210 [Bacteroidetes bacterium GWF2_43_63]|nr:MAG: hypothetical protein A2W94_10860 [Bacteroidetes bacterium GWE2_42_42]OFY55697.1 MAG: hypothetical protein A2W93_01210 [Bacteroidetes bacterium GWF2_43_63]HBG69496.1 hypothetical protein [Bacteroidales bacterium]HCB61337.1 hypothetical protein [Bacteroidales bacterium]HCY24212.1 hypothetical protein [Bacteroidales bacterium]